MLGYSRIEGSNRTLEAGAKATNRTDPNSTIEVTVKLRRKTALLVKGRPAAAISRSQFASRYGASKADIDKVVKAMAAFGLKVVDIDRAARSIRFSGTVGSMEDAFNVKLVDYEASYGHFHGRVGYVYVPRAVKGQIEAVFGLDNRRVARRGTGLTKEPGAKSAMRKAWSLPSELAARYEFPSGTGKGQTIGLIEFGGGFFPADLKHFCSVAGVREPDVVTLSVDGTPTNAKDGAEAEVMLDVEVVTGVCPDANLVVYFGSWSEQGWIAVLDAAIHDAKNDPSVLSISWGNAEDADNWTEQARNAVNASLKDAVMLGITVCCAAGDDGSSNAIPDGHAHVAFPGSSPLVLCVGGTSRSSKSTAKPDLVWKQGNGLRSPGSNAGSAGGGVSAVFKRPAWQSAIRIKSVNPGAIVGRVTPDVSANADWVAAPYLLVVDGELRKSGGTSASTALCAALVALINEASGARAGYLTPLLYQASSDGSTIGSIGCSDVVSGNNSTDKLGGYSAAPGYDAASGWGTPNGRKLLASLPFNGSRQSKRPEAANKRTTRRGS
jgi:kumamolisin